MEDNIDPMEAFNVINKDDVKIDKKETQKEDKKEDKKDDKKTKEDSIKDLRSQRDSLAEEKRKLEEKLKEYESFETLKPLGKIKEYLEKKTGKNSIEEKDVDEFINKNKERKKAISSLEEKLKEKDSLIKELDIDKSDEYKTEYIKPLSEAKTELISVIANFDKDKKIKHPELISALFGVISKAKEDGSSLNALEIRPILKEFSDKYKAKTGEEYDTPSIREVVECVRHLNERAKSAVDARKNWDSVIEEKRKEKLFQESVKREKLLEQEIRGRNEIISDIIESFDSSSFSNVVSKEDFEKSTRDHHKYFNSLLRKEDGVKPRGYKSLIESLAKSDLFDNLVEELNKTKELLSIEREKNKGPAPFKGGISKDDKQKNREKIEDPMDAFNKV